MSDINTTGKTRVFTETEEEERRRLLAIKEAENTKATTSVNEFIVQNGVSKELGARMMAITRELQTGYLNMEPSQNILSADGKNPCTRQPHTELQKEILDWVDKELKLCEDALKPKAPRP